MRQPPLVNRRIHLRLFILLFALLAGGCASFSSLQFPPIPQQSAVAGAPKVGIAAVQDARSLSSFLMFFSLGGSRDSSYASPMHRR